MIKDTPLFFEDISSALQSIIPSLTEWEVAHPEGRSVVLVAGPTGVGKTTFAKSAQDSDTTLLSLDRYFIPGVQPPGQPVNWSGPDVLDSALIVSDVAAMLRMPLGTKYSVPVYDLRKSERVGYENLELKRRLVVEGVYALRFLSKFETPFRIYIGALLSTLKKRKIERDVRERGLTKAEVTRRFFENVIPAIQQHVLPQRTIATHVVSNERCGEFILAQE